MKSQPRIGAIDTLAFVVKAEHAIDFSDQVKQALAILSTPWLIWFLEHAARQLMLPHLEDEEATWWGARGRRAPLSNTAGHEVRQAKLIFSDQRLFSLNSGHGITLIWLQWGTHKLKVIRKHRLAEVTALKQKALMPCGVWMIPVLKFENESTTYLPLVLIFF